jgi:hypothetical protein
MAAYIPPNHLPRLPLALAFHNPKLRVDMRIVMDKYEMNVRSLASQTFCSTLIGVASFSVEVQVEVEGSECGWK